MVHRILVAGGLGLAAAGVAGLLGLTSFVRTVELKTYDARVRWTADPARARRDIVLVAIDEDSVEKLEPLVGRFPWPRLVHAQLVDFLARGPAKVIAYDVLFSERDRRTFTVNGESWTGQESDRALAESIARAGNVVLAADASREGTGSPEDPAVEAGVASLPASVLPAYRLDRPIEERPILVAPFPELARAARAVGHTFTAFDADGPVRRAVPFIRVDGRLVPSLGLAAGMLAAGITPRDVTARGHGLEIGGRYLPLVEADIPSFYGEHRRAVRSLVNFRGPVMQAGKPTYREYSFYRLFYSEQQLLAGDKPLVDPAEFRGKIVVVGTTAAGLSDLFAVPFAGKMPGLQIHASVIDDLLSAHFMSPAPRWLTAAVTAGLALAVAAACLLSGVWPGVGLAALGLAAFGWISVAFISRGWWLDVTTPAIAVGLATFGGVSYQYFVEGREKRRIKRVFSRLVARDVYDHLLADPAGVGLGGRRREMTVLFSDIRGFTTVSERGEPEDIVRQLNEHFTRMVDVLFRYRGTVDKFVGDMVMALFGAPLADPDHAEHAVCAALDMLAALDDLNRGWVERGRPALDIGIGINTGEMVAGTIGSEQVMSYTVIGDAVNLGSRLESLNKQYGTHIIISEQTRARLKRRYDIHPLGQVVVKGKTAPVDIFEVRPAGGSIDRDGTPGPGEAA